MLVQVVPGPVVAPRGPRVSVTGSVLDVPQAGPGVEAQGHEGMAEIVGVESVALPGTTTLASWRRASPGLGPVPARTRSW